MNREYRDRKAKKVTQEKRASPVFKVRRVKKASREYKAKRVTQVTVNLRKHTASRSVNRIRQQSYGPYVRLIRIFRQAGRAPLSECSGANMMYPMRCLKQPDTVRRYFRNVIFKS